MPQVQLPVDKSSMKLPKFEIPKYSGDPMLWQTFWDLFRAAVHNKKHLSNVEKFSYLLSFLEDEALNVAKGYIYSHRHKL